MSLLIQKEGILTTVQGLGRSGLQRFGINPGGAMDRSAVRLINLLLGNADDEPAIEMHFPAAEIVFEKPCNFALGGAGFHAVLNGVRIENSCGAFAHKSSVLKFEKKSSGNRCYFAVKGGFRAKDGNARAKRAKDVKSLEEWRLRKGDRIALNVRSSKDDSIINRRLSNSILPVYSRFPTVRIVAGGEFDLLSAIDKQSLFAENFTITSDSNRMGYRLKGPPLRSIHSTEMLSAAVSFGTIQLLPDGQLIVLMAHHQTSGGYPRIANVISADLPLLAQLGANDKVAFNLVDIGEAVRASIQFEWDLQRLRIGCRFGRYWR